MRWLMLALIIASFPAAALAETPAPKAPAPATVGEAIEAVVAAGLAAVAALETQAKAAGTPDATLEFQRQIEQAKRGMSRRLLEVQLDFARREGNLKLAAELEGALARQDAPPRVAPQPRPAPAPATAPDGR